MVIKDGCFTISEADPAIAQVRKIEKDRARSLTKPGTPVAGS